MRRPVLAIQVKGTKVPAYIVTFSDMVTLLLTFFVMLLSLASVQDPELFNKGRGSFVQSLERLGLGVLSGAKPTLDFGHLKIKYSVDNPDESFEGRSINAKEEQVRRLFSDLSRSMNTMGSQIVAKAPSFSVTNVRFPRGGARLDESARRFLTEFCLNLQDSGPKSVKLYVLGLAGDEATEKEQWIVSARRAQAVADFLHGVLPLGAERRVYSWGAGPGGDWVRRDSPISKRSQILIAILRESD